MRDIAIMIGVLVLLVVFVNHSGSGECQTTAECDDELKSCWTSCEDGDCKDISHLIDLAPCPAGTEWSAYPDCRCMPTDVLGGN